MAPKSHKCFFVGYGDRLDVEAYRLYNPLHHKFLFTWLLVFLEDPLLHPRTPNIALTLDDASSLSDAPPLLPLPSSSLASFSRNPTTQLPLMALLPTPTFSASSGQVHPPHL